MAEQKKPVKKGKQLEATKLDKKVQPLLLMLRK